MAGQQLLFAETIAGMKRALARADDASDSDSSIAGPTNRGNKLKRKARYIQEGRLDTSTAVRAHRRIGQRTALNAKQKIEHAGYKRYIIFRNPPRLDEDGDEIYEEDDEYYNGTVLSEENPYSEVKIEHLLAPLTSAAELPTHPSLSIPYRSKNLTEMASQAEESLRREQVCLWKAKQLLARFRGDDPWLPCGRVEAEFDVASLAIHARDRVYPPGGDTNGQAVSMSGAYAGSSKVAGHAGEARDPGQSAEFAAGMNASMKQSNGLGRESVNAQQLDGLMTMKSPSTLQPINEDETSLQVEKATQSASNGIHKPAEPQADAISEPMAAPMKIGEDKQQSLAEASIDPKGEPTPAPDGSSTITPDENAPSPMDEDTSTLQPAAHRMTTRAQAHAHSKTPSPRSSSPTLVAAAEEIPPVHPFFSFPASAIPDRDLGLPPQEADDTRKLLLLFVQKQEEVVRGAQELCHGLLRADRMRKDVLAWTKAEAHVGEMSDGEDWYDREEWGLEEDLVKGRDEDDDEANAPGKKTRQRRKER